MQYSVRELRDKMEEKVTGLGVSDEFKSHPAFRSALIEIDVLIAQMNMFDVADSVVVEENNGKISFKWMSNFDVLYTMDIDLRNNECVRTILTEERIPKLVREGVQKEKRVIEKVAMYLDESVVLMTNGANVKDDIQDGKSMNRSFVDRKVYDKYGVMSEREFRAYPELPLSDDLDNLRVDSILYVPRGAFSEGFMSDHYDTRTRLSRHMIDTARVSIEDKRDGKKFNGELPLSTRYGVKNMELEGEFNYPKEVLIKPLSEEEIDVLVKREKNPTVALGLRSYAEGRSEYYYSSIDDNEFVCEVPELTKKFTS